MPIKVYKLNSPLTDRKYALVGDSELPVSLQLFGGNIREDRELVEIEDIKPAQLEYLGDIPFSPKEVQMFKPSLNDIWSFSYFGNPNIRGAGLIRHAITAQDLHVCIKYVQDLLAKKIECLGNLEKKLNFDASL